MSWRGPAHCSDLKFTAVVTCAVRWAACRPWSSTKKSLPGIVHGWVGTTIDKHTLPKSWRELAWKLSFTSAGLPGDGASPASESCWLLPDLIKPQPAAGTTAHAVPNYNQQVLVTGSTRIGWGQNNWPNMPSRVAFQMVIDAAAQVLQSSVHGWRADLLPVQTGGRGGP